MADDREVFARARRMISALCSGDQPWEMNVPARPDEDSDLVLAAAVTLGESLLAERDRLQAEVERLRGAATKLVGDVDELINNSEGVAGLHLNGDVAPWGELLAGGRFEEWLMSLESARSLLASGDAR